MNTHRDAIISRIQARNKRMEDIETGCSFEKFAFQCDDDEIYHRSIYDNLLKKNQEDTMLLDELDELDTA